MTGSETILLKIGVGQGDPLRSALFSLVDAEVARSISICYLDDATIGPLLRISSVSKSLTFHVTTSSVL